MQDTDGEGKLLLDSIRNRNEIGICMGYIWAFNGKYMENT